MEEKENETFKEKNEDFIMAYYCKLCQCWHYPGSDVHDKHKIYASQRHTPKKVVRRPKKSFWDSW